MGIIAIEFQHFMEVILYYLLLFRNNGSTVLKFLDIKINLQDFVPKINVVITTGVQYFLEFDNLKVEFKKFHDVNCHIQALFRFTLTDL